jgi:hypothetical protein
MKRSGGVFWISLVPKLATRTTDITNKEGREEMRK